MKKHRGLIWGLGLAAFIGLSASEAQAGPLTITVSWGANSVSIDYLSPLAQAGSTADTVTVNTSALNGFLAANGSAYTFASLGANSNNPGAANPIGANITESGEAILTTAGGLTTITIAANQSGFTAPTGIGTLAAASSALFTNANAGDSEMARALFNATGTPTLTYVKSTTANPESNNGSNSIGGLNVPVSGYSLGDTTTITMSSAGIARHANTGFTASAQLTATAVPEPSGIVMMVTAMPLPLVVVGLLRSRRRAKG